MTTNSLSLYIASQRLQDRLEWALSELCAPKSSLRDQILSLIVLIRAEVASLNCTCSSNGATELFFQCPSMGAHLRTCIMQFHSSSRLIILYLHLETCSEMIQKLYTVCFFAWGLISFPHLTFFPLPLYIVHSSLSASVFYSLPIHILWLSSSFLVKFFC